MKPMISCFTAVPIFINILSSAPTTTTATATNCTYASRAYINSVFSNLETGSFSGFFANVIETVDWDVQGTHPLAGQYNNKTIFFVNAVERLAQSQDLDFPDKITLVHVVGGCSEAWSVQELRETATLKNGNNFNNTYAWVTRWNTQGQIVQVRAYIDSALVAKSIFENEVTTNSTYSTPRTVLEPGPAGLPNLTGIAGVG